MQPVFTSRKLKQDLNLRAQALHRNPAMRCLFKCDLCDADYFYNIIGHFRITASLFFKASPGAHLSYEN